MHVIRSHEKFSHQHNLKLQREKGKPSVDIKLNLRPGVQKFMQDMSQLCNVALMTASHRSYAEVIYGFIDPKKEILCGVFHKDHCVNYSKGR